MDKQHKYNFENSIGKLTRQSAGAIGGLITKNFKKANIPFDSKDWMYISFIRNSNDISQQELANALGYNKVMINRGLTDLESKGLINRKMDGADNRVKRLKLTDKGEQIYLEMKSSVEDSLGKAYLGINEQEKQACIKVLEKLLTNIEKL